MIVMYIQIISKHGGITEALYWDLYWGYFMMCLFVMLTYIMINMVATDFILTSNQLDSIHNTLDQTVKSQLIEKFRKLKAGLSLLLFIYCTCFTVMLLSHTYFMVLNFKNNIFHGGIFHSISFLNVLFLVYWYLLDYAVNVTRNSTETMAD